LVLLGVNSGTRGNPLFPTSFLRTLSETINVARGGGPLLVAIDGPGCSGKSTLAQSLEVMLGDAAISIGTDEFFVPLSEQDLKCDPAAAVQDGIAHLRWHELRTTLDRLAQGQGARFRPYDWEDDVLGPIRSVPSKPVVLVEGLYSMHYCLRGAYAFKLWVDGASHTRMSRVTARDGERLLNLWHSVYIPRESSYLRSQRPFDHADAFVLGAGLEWETTGLCFCKQIYDV